MADKDTAKTYLALDEEGIGRVTQSLQVTLANTVFMYSLYKKYHWHVAGEDFYQYHKLFDKHAEAQLPLIDALAERLRTLGSHADAMPAEVAKLTTLVEQEEKAGHKPQAMIANLLAAHEAYLGQLRRAIDAADDADDEGTEDLLVSEVLRTHELQVWFLRSSLG